MSYSANQYTPSLAEMQKIKGYNERQLNFERAKIAVTDDEIERLTSMGPPGNPNQQQWLEKELAYLRAKRDRLSLSVQGLAMNIQQAEGEIRRLSQ